MASEPPDPSADVDLQLLRPVSGKHPSSSGLIIDSRVMAVRLQTENQYKDGSSRDWAECFTVVIVASKIFREVMRRAMTWHPSALLRQKLDKQYRIFLWRQIRPVRYTPSAASQQQVG